MNAPHNKWEFIKTFPKYFHTRDETTVMESYISDNPEIAIKEVLDFINLTRKKEK